MSDYRWYKVSTQVGGGLEVLVDIQDIQSWGEREAVGHAAWCRLWKKPETARVLQKLCNQFGVDAVKKKFIANIEYTE